jgi:RND family efflux transporter MFP subunit
MRYPPVLVAGIAQVLGLLLGFAGCARPSAQAPAAASPPSVAVSLPIEREVTDYADFTARTAAVDSVEVRARVPGYLDKVNFKEGALVKKGDVLFEIDPRTYRTALQTAEGNLAANDARIKRSAADLARARQLIGTHAISQEDLDARAAENAAAIAMGVALKAAVDRAQLDLGFSKVRAPISGRVSRYNVTVGNLVQPGDIISGTLLTTIVSVDPMYAYFDVDEHTVLRVEELIRAGHVKSAQDVAIPVWLGLANEDGFPHRGTIDFIDNQVNSKTGTIRVRGVFLNRDEYLLPGFFARVRVPIGAPHKSVLISERALDVDQGQKIVYVVDKDNRVVSQPVRLGALHDGLREITDGLGAGERVIVNGLQMVRSGATVSPKLVEMPSSKPHKPSQTATLAKTVLDSKPATPPIERTAGE